MKIFAGQYYIDENAGFWQGVSQGYSRFTKEASQTNLGYLLSEGRNMLGFADRVDYLGGATFITNEEFSKPNCQGITLGSYINIDTTGTVGSGSFDNYVTHDPLYMHEYGHTIDSRIYGSNYIREIGIASLISARFSKKYDYITKKGGTITRWTHDTFWTEIRANVNAKNYFKKHYQVDWDAYIDEKSTIEDHLPTR